MLRVALWNGKDPILKERLFGLTNSEGNHGEDVKEYYFYLDSTPTHSYMKYLYKYPQAAFPYNDLVETNRQPQPRRDGIRTAGHRRLQRGSLFRCVRGVCQADARRHPHPDQRLQSRAEAASLHVLPTLWFRNTWTWWPGTRQAVLEADLGQNGSQVIAAIPRRIRGALSVLRGDVPLLFTENETNNERIFGTPKRSPYVKDGINN